MARNIKGLTIEIGGDTTKLQSALKGVNGKIKETQAALRDVNKLLKLDPGNTQLLQQKYDLLGKSIDDTKDKLKTLKDAEKQATQQLANGQISQSEFDALQREIIETEQQLKGLEGEFKEFGSVAKQQAKAAAEEIGQLGGKVQEIGGKISGVGAGMTKTVTAPIVAIGTASVAAFKEVDDGLDIIAKKTGATGDQLKAMEDIASNIATTIPTSFETAGNAVGEVNTRFGLMGDELEDLSTRFIKFADLNDTDVVSSIDSVQTAMTALGVPTEQAAAFLDALNAVGQRSGADLNTLTGMISANAAQFKQMGISAADAINFLGDCELSSLDASKAMTGLNTAMKKAAKEGQTLPEALKAFQTEMDSAESSTQKLQAAIDLFGGKAGPQIYEAMSNGSLSFENFNSSLSSTIGNLDQTYDTVHDGMDDIEVAMNSLKAAGAEIGAVLSDMLPSVITPLVGAIKEFATWWGNLSEAQQDFIVKAAMVAAAVGPLLMVIGNIVSAIGSVMTFAPQIVSAVTSIIGVLKGLFALLMANPIGLVVAAIAALVAAFIYLWNNCEEFRQFWLDLWENIKEGAKAAADAIAKAWTGFVDSCKQIWQNVKEAFSKGVEAVLGVVNKVIDFVKNNWQGLLLLLVAPIAGAFKLIYDNCDGFREFWDNLLDGIKDKFHSIWDGIKSFMSGVIDFLKGIFNFQWELPKIKLPHFKISGEFSLNPPKVPTLSIDWYKKAQDNAYLLDGATIFGSRGGSLLGGGEAGSEMVVGKDYLMNMISQAAGGGIDPDALRAAFMEALTGMEMVAPVYIGQDRLDEAVAKVTLRATYRSGGR